MNPVSGHQPCDNTFFCGWVPLLVSIQCQSSRRYSSSLKDAISAVAVSLPKYCPQTKTPIIKRISSMNCSNFLARFKVGEVHDLVVKFAQGGPVTDAHYRRSP